MFGLKLDLKKKKRKKLNRQRARHTVLSCWSTVHVIHAQCMQLFVSGGETEQM